MVTVNNETPELLTYFTPFFSVSTGIYFTPHLFLVFLFLLLTLINLMFLSPTLTINKH